MVVCVGANGCFSIGKRLRDRLPAPASQGSCPCANALWPAIAARRKNNPPYIWISPHLFVSLQTLKENTTMKITKIKTKAGTFGSPVSAELGAIVERMQSADIKVSADRIAAIALHSRPVANGTASTTISRTSPAACPRTTRRGPNTSTAGSWRW